MIWNGCAKGCSVSGGYSVVRQGQHFKVYKNFEPTFRPCPLPPWWPETGIFFLVQPEVKNRPLYLLLPWFAQGHALGCHAVARTDRMQKSLQKHCRDPEIDQFSFVVLKTVSYVPRVQKVKICSTTNDLAKGLFSRSTQKERSKSNQKNLKNALFIGLFAIQNDCVARSNRFSVPLTNPDNN